MHGPEIKRCKKSKSAPKLSAENREYRAELRRLKNELQSKADQLKRRCVTAWRDSDELSSLAHNAFSHYDWFYAPPSSSSANKNTIQQLANSSYTRLSLDALNTLHVWLVRFGQSKLSRAIELTRLLLESPPPSPADVSSSLSTPSHAHTNTTQHACAHAIAKFVTRISAQDGGGVSGGERGAPADYAIPLASLAARIGLPDWLVALRNEIVHESAGVPSSQMARLAYHECVRWLWLHFWRPFIATNDVIDHVDVQSVDDECEVAKVRCILIGCGGVEEREADLIAAARILIGSHFVTPTQSRHNRVIVGQSAESGDHWLSSPANHLHPHFVRFWLDALLVSLRLVEIGRLFELLVVALFAIRQPIGRRAATVCALWLKLLLSGDDAIPHYHQNSSTSSAASSALSANQSASWRDFVQWQRVIDCVLQTDLIGCCFVDDDDDNNELDDDDDEDENDVIKCSQLYTQGDAIRLETGKMLIKSVPAHYCATPPAGGFGGGIAMNKRKANLLIQLWTKHLGGETCGEETTTFLQEHQRKITDRKSGWTTNAEICWQRTPIGCRVDCVTLS